MNMPDVKVEVGIFTLYMHFAPTPSTAVSAHLTTASLLFLIIGIFFFSANVSIIFITTKKFLSLLKIINYSNRRTFAPEKK